MSEFVAKETLIGGKYEIIKPIAKGGFSVVYLAKERGTDNAVALKLLNLNDDVDEVWLQRFKREAKLIRRLHHENTVRVFDFGEDEEFLYIAMEYIRGRSLYRQIKKYGALEPRHVAEITLMLCHALKEAHALGILHRDLKPSNVMLTDVQTGFSAKVLDFGSAKQIEHIPIGNGTQVGLPHRLQNITQQGVFVGTPRYAAPEQLLQETVDVRTDIYGLGMVMWEAMVGDPAVAGLDYAECIEKHLGPAPWLLPLSNNAPSELSAIVHRALQKNPNYRYQNVSEMANALTDFLQRYSEDSELIMMISEASDPIFDNSTSDLAHGISDSGVDESGLDEKSDPLFSEDLSLDFRKKTQPTKRLDHIYVAKRNAQISEVEELELDYPIENVQREPAFIPNSHSYPKTSSLSKSLPYIVLGIIAGILAFVGYAVFQNQSTFKNEILEKVALPVEKTIPYERVPKVLRVAGWLIRENEPLPYQEGIFLRTIIADKKGKRVFLHVFVCTNRAQVRELETISENTTEHISIASIFLRWKDTESGSEMMRKTLREFQKLQKSYD